MKKLMEEARVEFVNKVIDKIAQMKIPFFLGEPYIKSEPVNIYYCSLCNTSEDKFEQDKENIYKCKCSVWEYVWIKDKYKWIRWNDKGLAIKLAKQYDNKENNMNEAYDNVIKLLQEMKNTE